MKALFLIAALASLATAAPLTWTDQNSQALEARSLAFAKQLPGHTLMVGRLGLPDTRVAVLVTNEGHLLSPLIESIDGEPSPYLRYHSDGRREELTTVLEDEKLSLALLKSDAPLPGLTPVALAERVDDTVFVIGCSPIVTLGEPASFQIDHLLYQPTEEATVFALDQQTHKLGDAIFNLDGKLVGLTYKFTRIGTQGLLINRILTRVPELGNILPELENSSPSRLPAAPQLDQEAIKELDESAIRKAREKQALGALPNPLPSVLIFNVDQQLTHSIIGTIVGSNGLILTKASELGPDLKVRYKAQSYPAVILSTDEASDLALIGIAATTTPVIRWNDSLPPVGSALYAPKLLQENTQEMIADETSLVGTYSGLYKANTPSLHTSSAVTSLGIVTEQVDNGLKIAALRPDSNALESGLTVGDVIVGIGGKTTPTRRELTTILESHQVGDKVQVEALRGEAKQKYPLTLVARDQMPPATGISASGVIPMIPSVRRSPFPDCLTHNLPLNAWDCGSPVFDNQGRALGLNIAAHSPGRTLALTPGEVRAALSRLLASSRQF